MKDAQLVRIMEKQEGTFYLKNTFHYRAVKEHHCSELGYMFHQTIKNYKLILEHRAYGAEITNPRFRIYNQVTKTHSVYFDLN